MDRFERSYAYFKKAFKKYEDLIVNKDSYKYLAGELLVEIATKRFEYTFEIMWKSLREYLFNLGIECNSPLKCLKEAFKEGLIPEDMEKVFVEIVKKRNDIIHTYDESKAKRIYKFIISQETYSAIKVLMENLLKD